MGLAKEAPGLAGPHGDSWPSSSQGIWTIGQAQPGLRKAALGGRTLRRGRPCQERGWAWAEVDGWDTARTGRGEAELS